jgi:hypothetical protein
MYENSRSKSDFVVVLLFGVVGLLITVVHFDLHEFLLGEVEVGLLVDVVVVVVGEDLAVVVQQVVLEPQLLIPELQPKVVVLVVQVVQVGLLVEEGGVVGRLFPHFLRLAHLPLAELLLAALPYPFRPGGHEVAEFLEDLGVEAVQVDVVDSGLIPGFVALVPETNFNHIVQVGLGQQTDALRQLLLLRGSNGGEVVVVDLFLLRLGHALAFGSGDLAVVEPLQQIGESLLDAGHNDVLLVLELVHLFELLDFLQGFGKFIFFLMFSDFAL